MTQIFTDAPAGVGEAIDISMPVKDFLPSPDELVGKAKKRRITITLSDRSIVRFKDFAKKKNTKYQTLISELVDSYSRTL